MKWLVTRHPGAREWAQAHGTCWDRCVPHLKAEDVAPGDAVFGTLPAHQAARIIARGACYHHLQLDVPAGWRGRELSAAELERLGARFVRLHVEVQDE